MALSVSGDFNDDTGTIPARFTLRPTDNLLGSGTTAIQNEWLHLGGIRGVLRSTHRRRRAGGQHRGPDVQRRHADLPAPRRAAARLPDEVAIRQKSIICTDESNEASSQDEPYAVISVHNVEGQLMGVRRFPDDGDGSWSVDEGDTVRSIPSRLLGRSGAASGRTPAVHVVELVEEVGEAELEGVRELEDPIKRGGVRRILDPVDRLPVAAGLLGELLLRQAERLPPRTDDGGEGQPSPLH